MPDGSWGRIPQVGRAAPAPGAQILRTITPGGLSTLLEGQFGLDLGASPVELWVGGLNGAEKILLATEGATGTAIGSSPPTSPGNGQLWWDPVSGNLFVWYNDGNSSQWVPAVPVDPGGAGGGGGAGTITGVTAGTGLTGGGTSGNITVALSHPVALTSAATVPTAAPGTSSTQVASTAFVQAALSTTGVQGPQGAAGAQGSQGATGTGTQGPQGAAGTQGPQGSDGTQGSAGAQGSAGNQGAMGAALVIKGTAANHAAILLLPGPHVVGDLWIALDNGHGWVWSGTQFDDVGQIQGSPGVQGVAGAQGSQGSSGPQGDAGAQGSSGAQGSQGADGAQGSQGAAGAQGAQGAQPAPIVSATEPTTPAPVAGDLWFDTVNNLLKTYNGTTWVAAGTPTGGAQYEVLSKASAASGDVEWRGAGERPNQSTAIGASALNPASTGIRNTACGVSALAANTTGQQSVAIGAYAMWANTAGRFSVAVGVSSLMTDTEGTHNTALGYNALQQTMVGAAVGANTAVGANAFMYNVGGLRNVALGYNAGILPNTGNPFVNDSIYIGSDVGATPSASHEIIIGSRVTGAPTPLPGKGSNTITLGNDAVTALYTRAGLVLGDDPTGGAKGPGTINLPASGGYYVDGEPLSALPTGGAQYDVLSKASATSGDVAWRGAGERPNNNTVIGAGALPVVTGSNNVAIGANALGASTANFNVALGFNAAAATNGSGVVAIGRQALQSATTGNFLVAIGDQAMRFANTAAVVGAVAIGSLALQAVNTLGAGGGNDVAIGSGSLSALITSGRNVAVGASAGSQFGPGTGSSLLAATRSVFIGSGSRAFADAQTNEICIGSETIGRGSNTITLGDEDVTALYTRAGLVLGDDPTGGAKGPGTINLPASGGYYVDGEPLSALPTGGAIYDVLSKASATSGDVEWRGAGVRPNSNTVIGAGAFNLTATGSGSVAFGVGTLGAATTGSNNVAIGLNAAASLLTGHNNIAIGRETMRFANPGSNNVAIGWAALRDITNIGSISNIAVGSNAGFNLVNGAENVMIGHTAGMSTEIAGVTQSMTASERSIFIGCQAFGGVADNQINQIVIGYSGVGNGSNTITLGNHEITALYTRAGLVLGDDPTGGAKGPGTINLPASDGYYIDGEPLGTPVTVCWTAGTSPDRVVIFVNTTGRPLVCRRIVGIVEEPNGGTANLQIFYAEFGDLIRDSTIRVDETQFNANGVAGQEQVMLSTTPFTINPGGRIGLKAVIGSIFISSIATITAFVT